MKQGSAEWLEARREMVTATDIGVLLGLSPWKCEADLADEKLTGVTQPATLRMRIGTAVEPLIAEAYQEQTGRKVHRVHGLWTHPEMRWAGASPDYRVVGEKRLMEAKFSESSSRWADGLPQNEEAQVRWQLGVSGYPVEDVAVLIRGELQTYEVEHDPAVFADLVAVAEDFRARLAAGGPFSRDSAYIKRQYPRDDGSEMVADAELTEAVLALVALRAQRKDIEASEDNLETLVKTRMEAVSKLVGPGWYVSWKKSKDSEVADWKSIADGLLRQMPADEREALVSIHTTVRPGMRPFRVVVSKED